jgi:hypothetical protein
MTDQHPKLAPAVRRFRDEVYANASTIDPLGNYNWHDIAMGFLLACGVPSDTLSWELMSNLACGEFNKYLEPNAPTPREWANTVFTNNPEVVTVRLGYGFGSVGREQPIAWMDFKTNTGEHHASSQDKPLITTPDSVTQWVRANIPLGTWVDYEPEP